MEEANTQQTPSESVTTPSENVQPVDQTQQTTPNQPTENQGSAEKAPESKLEPEKSYEFDGNYEKLKDEHPEIYKYAVAARRYQTRKDEEHVDKLKMASEYEQVKNSPVWNQFVQYYNGQQNQGTPQDSEVTDTVDPDTKQYIQERENAYMQKITGLEKQLNRVSKTNEISMFADLNPNFWDYDDKGLIEPFLNAGDSVAKAYEKAEKIIHNVKNEQIKQSQSRVAEKANATSFGPSISNESNVVWVDKQSDVLPAATELSLRGEKNKIVKVRQK